MNRSARDRYLPWLFSVVIVVLDQLTKYLIRTTFEPNDRPFDVLGSFLRWSYIQNDGIVFGLEMPGGRLLGIFSLLATVVFVFFLVRMHDEALIVKVLLGCIIGGAIGNAIDRIAFGYVIDFIDVGIPHWPYVFNIADSAVSVSVTLMIVYLLFFYRTDRDESDVSLAELDQMQLTDNQSDTIVNNRDDDPLDTGESIQKDISS